MNTIMFPLEHFVRDVRHTYYGVLYSSLLLTNVAAQLNDGHYSEEDDAKVLPIVLPIVLVVVAVCIIACCWQGGKCPCNKKDDKKDKKKDSDQDSTTDQVFTEKESQRPSSSRKKAVGNKPSTRSTSRPPSYATATKNKELPLKSSARHESADISNGANYNTKRSSRSVPTSGYDEKASSRKVEEKYRVIDYRPSRNERVSSQASPSYGRYGRDNGAYHDPEAGHNSQRYSSRQTHHQHNTHYNSQYQ